MYYTIQHVLNQHQFSLAFAGALCYHKIARRYSSPVERQLPKLHKRVRLPLPAPKSNPVFSMNAGLFFWCYSNPVIFYKQKTDTPIDRVSARMIPNLREPLKPDLRPIWQQASIQPKWQKRQSEGCRFGILMQKYQCPYVPAGNFAGGFHLHW